MTQNPLVYMRDYSIYIYSAHVCVYVRECVLYGKFINKYK
jgi:hypothetical protein